MTKRNGRSTKVRGITAMGNRKYRIRVRVTHPETGKRVEKERMVVAGSIKEAAAIKEELTQELLEVQEEREVLTVGGFAKTWLRGAWINLAPSTRDRYVAALDDHILPVFGDQPIGEVRFSDIEVWRDSFFKKGYAASTVNAHLAIVRTLFAKALVAGVLDRNPALGVRSLIVGDSLISADEPNSLSPSELSAFLRVAAERQSQHYAMILTLATTGMRLSAARALRWEDIDHENGVILVRRRVSGRHNEVIPGVKRSRKGQDVVPLVPLLARELKQRHLTMSKAERESGWVFPTKDGGIRAKSVLNKPFADILRHARIRTRFTPHGLRRTANNMYRQVASPLVTMAITGHRTESMFEHYSSVTYEEKRKAAEAAFASLVSRADSKGGNQGGMSPSNENSRSESTL